MSVAIGIINTLNIVLKHSMLCYNDYKHKISTALSKVCDTIDTIINSGRNCIAMDEKDIQIQINEWRKQGWSIPDFRGGKQSWFNQVTSIIQYIGDRQSCDINEVMSFADSDQHPLRVYVPFIKSVGLVQNSSGMVTLTVIGQQFLETPTKAHLANLMQGRYRLFAEMLALVSEKPQTVEEIDKQICARYGLNWINLSNTRRRLDWLEILGLIQPLGNRKWEITKDGLQILKGWCLVSPKAIESLNVDNKETIEIQEAPEEIKELLRQLKDNPENHKNRNTYNIWVPSPDRINNLRIITQFASERITRKELFEFIEKRFNLRTSSADSMLPFLKASGLIEEVGRAIYVASDAAKAWLETGNDLDFIRILHSHMQFVGEMIAACENDIIRNDLYSKAKQYGLNQEKARWIAGFLIEAGLLEEPQYLHLKATASGKVFVNELPLTNPNQKEDNSEKGQQEVREKVVEPIITDKLELTITRLLTASKDPMAEGKQSGMAFEEEIAEIFRLMGFDARRIGGSGDTDVVLHWTDTDGKDFTAIVDGKSKSSGFVSHSDISDIAIDTHRDKNHASYVAIVGPGFSGETIRNHAIKKGFALITADELCEIARSAKNIGLNLQEIACLFDVPNGLSTLSELISEKQRELEIITTVVGKIYREQGDLGGLSPRDLFLLLRDNSISPSLKELLNVFETLSKPEIGVLQVINKNKNVSPENASYMLFNGQSNARRLIAIADAIQKGLKN